MFSISLVYGQDKKIKKAIEALNENNYTEYNSLLNDYVNEAPEVPLAAYALSLGFTKPGSPSYDLEKGFKKLQTVKDWLSSNEADKGWCKSFGLCAENIHAQIDSIAITALRQVEQNKTDESYQKFIKVYTNTPINDKAILSYHHWKFELASSANTVESLESFIKQFPNAQDVSLAKAKIERIEYIQTVKSGEIFQFEAFLKKYPSSIHRSELQQKLIDLEFKQSIESNEVSKMEAFLKKYPNSSYTAEVKTKIEEIDFSNAKKASSKEPLEAFIRDYPNSKYIEEAKKKLKGMNVESIIATGSGRTKDLAISNCIFGATRVLSNMFLSSEVIVQNENFITESIKQISSGEILDYEIISERTLEDTLFEITLKLTFRLDTLSGFFKSKGMSLNFDNNSFVYKIKNQKIKENQEIEIIYDLIGNLNEGLQTSFDYSLQAFTPVKSSITPLDWSIPLKVIVKSNDAFKKNYSNLINTLKYLSLSDKEVEEYTKYNKELHPITLINTNNSQSVLYLRNRNSLKAINLLFSNYFNFLTSFNIVCETDSLNGHNIEYYNGFNCYYQLSDPTFALSDIISNEELYKKMVNVKRAASVNLDIINEFKVSIVWKNPLKSYFKDLNNYTLDNQIYRIDLINLIDIDTLAIINLNHLVRFEDIKKLTQYKIQSNGLRYKYRKKGMVLTKQKDQVRVLLLNYFDRLRYEEMDSTFMQIPFSSIDGVRIPNLLEFKEIFSSPFHKLLLLPNVSWCNEINKCSSNDSPVYRYSVDNFGDYWLFKRYHGYGCNENARATNIILIYEN